MYHVKLVKAHSYTGIISATKENPDVFAEDRAIAEAAVATGYFELVGKVEQRPGQGIRTESLDREQLEKMKREELKKLAEELEIDTDGFKKNSDYVDAIVAAEVTTETENEADFGEGE